MSQKTKKEIEQYAKRHKGSFVHFFKRDKKSYISFRDKEGRFTGWTRKNKDSLNAIKKYNSFKAYLTFKIKGERKKREIIYNFYNRKQQKQILFRMNKKVRRMKFYQKEQKRYKLPYRFKEDAVPFIKDKKIIDLLIDKYKFEPVKIEKFSGDSP